ncbi:hypothetical protein CTI14_20010 [Methylobacterium radiotolerans]|nr:hypothetical protein CTI14_20010 [Methylobacterium radiotolerans]
MPVLVACCMPDNLRLQLENETGEPLIELRAAEPLDLRQGRKVILPADLAQKFKDVVQGTVSVAAGLMPTLTQGGTYRLVMTPQMQQALREGQTEFIKTSGNRFRAVLRNADGKEFAGLPELEPAALLSLSNVVTVAFRSRPLSPCSTTFTRYAAR